MPALNFKSQFVPFLRNGRKPHTVRVERKYPIKAGDILHLYTGMRTKQCKLVMITACVRVLPIQIFSDLFGVTIGHEPLSAEEIRSFAWHDGFDSLTEFFGFFKIYPLDVRENKLRVIYWR